MKRLRLIWLIFLIFCFPVLSEGSFKWRELGRAPLMPGVEDEISLQKKFKAHKDDIEKGLKMAEPSWNVGEVITSLETAIWARRMDKIYLLPEQKLEWMIFKPKEVTVEEDVEWVGKGPLEGFLITIVVKTASGEVIVDIFISKKCGNIALVEKRALTVHIEPLPRVERRVERVEKVHYVPSPIYYPYYPYYSYYPFWGGRYWGGFWRGPGFYSPQKIVQPSASLPTVINRPASLPTVINRR